MSGHLFKRESRRSLGRISTVPLKQLHDSRHMYLGRFADKELGIFKAECDGSHLSLIHESKVGSPAELQLSGTEDEVLILSTNRNGSLSSVSAIDGVEKKLTNNITEGSPVALALLNDVAILRNSSKTYALFFW